jgi:hypothetical protein
MKSEEELAGTLKAQIVPPCAMHLPLPPTALFGQLLKEQRCPPPCDTHMFVEPWAPLMHPGREHLRPPP